MNTYRYATLSERIRYHLRIDIEDVFAVVGIAIAAGFIGWLVSP